MKIARLLLPAFGPFQRAELGFAPQKGVLDLVYGPNEAGKSTTLRALIALLYGIPARTQDAHLHEMSRLRVGANLIDHHGRSLSVMRRKGVKQTLLDADDEPLPDHVLSELLGGMDESMFRQMFGLDHERLREGAEALLSGGGNVGESLFDAGTGARAIRSVLEGLKQEADELFKPRGTTTKLQVAVRALREQQRARKDAMLSPQAFVEQRRALAETRSELDAALARRQDLLTERSRLARALTVMPLFARRDVLSSERNALHVSGTFDAQIAEQASALEAALSSEEREHEQLLAQRAFLQTALADLPAAGQRLLAHELVRELEQRFGAYRKSEEELPRRRGELSALQGDLALLRTRVGAALGALDKLDTPARARLRKLADEERALELAERSAREELLQREQELSRARERLAACTVAQDATRLSALIATLEQDARALSVPRLESELSAKLAENARMLARLGLPLPAEALTSLLLPDELELERLTQERAETSAHRRRLVERTRTLELECERLLRERAELLAEGEVVTEDTLREARAARNGLYERLEQTTNTSDFRRISHDFRGLLTRTDELADRLRREAARTGNLLRMERELAAFGSERERVAGELSELSQRAAGTDEELRRLLAPLGLAGEKPAQAREKLRKLAVLVARAGEADSLSAELSVAHRHARELAMHLCEALALPAQPERSLAELLAQARLAVAQREREASQRAELSERVNTTDASVRELGLKRSRLAERRALFSASLGEELSRLAVSESLSADELLATVDDLVTLQTKQREAHKLELSLATLEAENSAFLRDLARLCTEHGLGQGTAPEAAMALLVEEQRKADREQRERTRLASELEKLGEQLAAKEHALRAFAAERAQLFELRAVTSFAELRERTRGEKRAAELDSQLEDIDLQLASASEGLSLEELRTQVRSLDPDQARARNFALDGELETVGEEIDARNRELGRLSAGLEQLKGESGAVALAEEAESQLSNVRGLARRYAELRLGYALLSQEVERYRTAHQGPLLKRASQLFPRLTLDRYKRLEVVLDERDQPVLACIRQDDKSVRVEGLSDGTRDQLYLSLRVASIERYLETNPPMPLILDDAFVHFDDARSTAALSVLGELAQKTQVIFFTHHARMLELAKKALARDKLLVHELDPVRGVIRTRDDGPLFARL